RSGPRPFKTLGHFDQHMGTGQKQIMFDNLKDDTAACMADGAHTLARVWEAAWLKGRAGKPKLTSPVASDQDLLMQIYTPGSFLRSNLLQVLREEDGRIVGPNDGEDLSAPAAKTVKAVKPGSPKTSAPKKAAVRRKAA